MPHILFIANAFHPLNNMGAHRFYLRTKSFDRHGFKVSVITRIWSEGAADSPKQPKGAVGPIVCEKLFTNARVYRVPFGVESLGPLNILQRTCLALRGRTRSRVVTRTLDYLGSFIFPLDYQGRLNVNLPELAGLLESPPDYVLASGDPWSNFEVGRAAADYFGAKYIAEYRDPWGYLDDRFKIMGFNSYNENILSQLKRKLMIRKERRLNRTANLIIAASPPFLANSLELLGIPSGHVALNGFDREEFDSAPRVEYPKFTLSYIGTIYSQQRTEVFFQALQTFIERNGIDPGTIQINLVGSKYSHGFEQTEKRMRVCRHYDQVMNLTERLDKVSSLTIQKSSHVLLFFAHEKSEGIYPGKIFEYIAANTPILLSPSDHGVLEGLLKETKTGAVCDSEADVVSFLETAYKGWKSSGRAPYAPDQKAIEQYTYDGVAQALMAAIRAL